MELLPIIYNSLIIAAGLFVITVAISYVSYKIKDNRPKEGKASTHTPQKQYLKEDGHSELKPKFKSPPPVTNSGDRVRKPKKEEEKKKEIKRPKPSSQSHRTAESKHAKSESNTRIEVVRDLSKSSTKETETPKSKPVEKPKHNDEKKKKKLKSIDEDPIKKYTDSADDDLHPLKTDE